MQGVRPLQGEPDVDWVDRLLDASSVLVLRVFVQPLV